MSAESLLVEIVASGGGIAAQSGKLTLRAVPAHLVPLIKEHKTELINLLTLDATIAPTVQHGTAPPRQSATTAVTCGQCARFKAGPQLLAIGVGLSTVTGQPPVPAGQHGDYRAAFPMAPRRCPEYIHIQEGDNT